MKYLILTLAMILVFPGLVLGNDNSPTPLIILIIREIGT